MFYETQGEPKIIETPGDRSDTMSWLEYGNEPGAGESHGEAYHYTQFVHLPNGITKLSGQGGWTNDGSIDANDWKAQIENAFDNVERVLKAAGMSGWEDVSR